MSRPLRRLPLSFDLIGLGVLAIGQAVAFLPSYGNGWLWVAVLGGTALGIGLGLLSAARGWNPAATALVTTGAWFGLGGLLAMPDSNIGYVIPSLRTLRGLATGPVNAWRDMLTIAPPLGTTWNLMTVPLLIAVVNGLIGITLARRSGLPTLAWLPGTIGVAVGFLLGTHRSIAPPAVGIGLVVVVLVWTSMQRARARTTLVRTASSRRMPQLLSGALVLAVVSALTWAVAGFVDPSQPRTVLREIVAQPLDVRAYPSPLQGFRANINAQADDLLFTVTGAPSGSRIRLATLDSYDGLTYKVTNTDQEYQPEFVRVGARIDDPTVGERYQVEVRLAGYQGVWLPNLGATRDVVFTGDRATSLGDTMYHNMASGTTIVTAGLAAGDGYRLDAVVASAPTEAEIRNANAGRVELPEPADVPDRLRDLATVWTTGASSAGEAALMLSQRFASTGWFSHGVGDDETPSLPGHSYSRMATLLVQEEAMVGDQEQYAVAMALMARSLGLPARVLYGYQVPEGGAGEVRGRDVSAWTEVNLAGLGWVTFDPTPAPERILQNFDPIQSAKTRPHVENPPPPPERPEVPPSDNQMPVDQSNPPPEPPRIDIARVLQVTTVFGLPLLVLVGPLVLILGLKNRRRRTRMNDPQPANRVAGGWAEFLDQARDLGASISPAATRSEQAALLSASYPKLERSVDTNRLARQADASSFAPEPVNDDQASQFWRGVDLAVRGLRASVPSRAAWLGRLSTRSFRRFG